MKNHKKSQTVLIVFVSFLLSIPNLSALNRNFYIYLCFGQSNMQGAGPIQSRDISVNSRFKVFQAQNCSNLTRTKGTWYTAVPPTCQCYSNLSPADYFGRTMVANLPDSITVGIINVSVAGCDIRLFDKDIYRDYVSTYKDDWFTSLVASYDGNPYQYLINLARLARNDGVIKGILLHQGETNTGNTLWPTYVNKIYRDMLSDLALKADSVPLLVGEVLSVKGNCCAGMNPIINTLPDIISTAYIIPSNECTGQDNAHFDSEGYRKFGRRYAVKMLSLLGYNSVYAEAECGATGNNLNSMSDSNASNLAYVTGLKNLSIPPADDADILKMSVSLSAEANYYLYGRFNNSNTTHNSFWLKIDEGKFELYENMSTNGWEWLELKGLSLTAGEHTFSFAFSDNGIMLDKIAVKNSRIKPVDVGEEAAELCEAKISTGFVDINSKGYSLEQNYPNPVTNRNINITFNIPNTNFVSLKIFNSMGVAIDELAGRVFYPGKHSIAYNLEKLKPGIYFYCMVADNFSATRKMMITLE